MRLHVLTACSRPGLLPAVAQSIATAACEPWEVCWHVRFDIERQHVGGQYLKNQMLDQITDGWVCFLDDDTTMHPEFPSVVASWQAFDAVVVTQTRSDGRTLVADAANLVVGGVDIGQAAIRRELIGARRIPLSYEGDGIFLTAVLTDENVAYVDEAFSYHNQLDTMAAA